MRPVATKQNKSVTETNLGYEHNKKIRLTAENQLDAKTREGKIRGTLLVDEHRAKVTVSDVSGNRSNVV